MIEFGWGDYEQSYLVLTFKGKWTVKDFSDAISGMYQEVSMIGKKVHVIVDLRYSATPPLNIMTVAPQALTLAIQHGGRIIILTQKTLWKRVYDALIHYRNDQLEDIHFVDSVDKAYKLLIAEASGS